MRFVCVMSLERVRRLCSHADIQTKNTYLALGLRLKKADGLLINLKNLCLQGWNKQRLDADCLESNRHYLSRVPTLPLASGS